MTRETPSQIVRRTLSQLQPGNNIRSDLGSEAERWRLARSLKKGQLTPLLILANNTVLDGNRRLDAAPLEGIEEFDCIVVPDGTTPAQCREIQWRCAVHRMDISAYDKAVAIRDIKAENPALTNRQLADDILGIDPSSVTHYLGLWDCIPEAQEAAKAGKIGLCDWYAISISKDQAATLDLALNGSSAAAVASESRRQRNGHSNSKPAARLIRVKIPVTTDAATGTVVLDLPACDDLAPAVALLKDAKSAIGLPQLRMTPPGADVPGTVTVARKPIDAQAATLIEAALKVVQHAKARRLTVKKAMVEWQERAATANGTEATQPQTDTTVTATTVA